MKKCYKVVREKKITTSEIVLQSIFLKKNHPFCRLYSTRTIVDMGYVFTDLQEARHLCNEELCVWRLRIYLADASVLIPWDEYAELIEIQQYWDGEKVKMHKPRASSTCLGFDIRLVKRLY
ncbi:MAG TPA: hypothetical protein ENG87_02855 [Candidatus Pacearchaeota archaeon]|nr:hypothetical protein [Candidatus Pacearchaeota archaeon]